MEKKNKDMTKAQPKRGLWKPEEDLILKNYIETHGEGNWATVSKRSGLMRGGKSCRLRWKNYLRPNIKRGGMSKEEEDLIIRMHKLLGNRWSLIAGRLPGRTDNEVKNYWNTHLNKKSLLGKRKAMDSNTQQAHHDKELHNENPTLEQDTKKSTQSPEKTTQETTLLGFDDNKKQQAKEEELSRDRTLLEMHAAAAAAAAAAQCFNYEYLDYYDYDMVETTTSTSHQIQTPLMVQPNYLDEEPFTSYLDSFVLFEAFGTDSSDRVALGIQSFLP